MKLIAAAALLAIAASCTPRSIELGWNTSWRSDVPYELRFDADKLGSSQWVAAADGKELETVLIDDGSAEGVLRFTVPSGTEKLMLKKGHPSAASSTDFPKLPEFEPGKRNGTPARLELDIQNTYSKPLGIRISLLQFDKQGNRLPEEVADGRWLTHLQPSQIVSKFRERAWIHPLADSVKLVVSVTGETKEETKLCADSVNVLHFQLRPAAEFPFPAFDRKHFGKGVSGGNGDFSICLGKAGASANGGDPVCFWYQTRSQASWAGGYQMRDPKTFFYPVGEGTVEAWFKPESSSYPEPVPLFEASHHASIAKGSRFALGRFLYLTYDFRDKTAALSLRDADGKAFSGKAATDIPQGRWSHVAVTFDPAAEAVLYVNGEPVLNLPLEGFKPVAIADEQYPNDAHAMEFYLGSSYVRARGFTENDRRWQNITDFCETEFTGEADLLRISDTVRYATPFTPLKDFTPDAATKALFDFNERIDGTNVGGAGIVTGVLKTTSDLHSHTLVTDKGEIRYYPDELTPENDIRKVLVQQNYPTVPDGKDFTASDLIHRVSFDMVPGQKQEVKVGKDEPFMDFVEIENTSDKVLDAPAVLREGDVDFRSFDFIAETLPDKSANTVFNYAISASDYFMLHQIGFDRHSDVPFEAKDRPLLLLGSYCGFECGPLNKMLTQLYAYSAGIPSNHLSGYGHAFQQIYFDGKNHVYDLSGQKFYSNMDNETSAGLDDMERQPGVFAREDGSCAHFIKMGTRKYGATRPDCPPEFSYRLRPGERIRLWWNNSCSVNDLEILARDKEVLKTDLSSEVHSAKSEKTPVYRIDRFFPEYGNAYLEFKGKPDTANPAFCRIEEDSFCYLVETSYPVTEAAYRAVWADGKDIPLEISTDSLRTFRPFTSPATYSVRARTGYFIKVCAPVSEVSSFEARTVMHTNVRVQTGRLKSGSNKISFKAGSDSGSAKVTFQYRTRCKDIDFKEAVSFGSIRGCEQSLILLDPDSGKATVSVEGASADARLEALDSKGLDAVWKVDGKLLEMSATDGTPRFAWVRVRDIDNGNTVEKTLTVLICPGARMVKSPSSLSRSSAEFRFKPLPAGRYAILALDRFPGGIVAQRDRIVSLKAGDYNVPACSGVNEGCNYYKAPFGPKGGRANWKWDYPYSEKYSYPYDEMRIFDLKAFDSLAYTNETDTPVEIAAILVLPEPERDFKCDILKNLCSVNARPWAQKYQ